MLDIELLDAFFSHEFQQKMQSLELAQSKPSFEVTGQTIAQNLASVPDLDFGAQGVILPLERLRAAKGVVAGS